MPIFSGKRKRVHRKDFFESLRKGSSKIPSRSGWTTHRERYNRKGRIELGKKRFPRKKYGEEISEKEYKKMLFDLRKDKFSKSKAEREKIEKEIRWWEEQGGFKK
jgi:hypothetical protein